MKQMYPVRSSETTDEMVQLDRHEARSLAQAALPDDGCFAARCPSSRCRDAAAGLDAPAGLYSALQAAGLLSGVDWASAGAVGSRGRAVEARRLLEDCRRRGPACSCVAEADIAAGAIGSLGRGVAAVEDLGRFVDLCIAAGWSR